MLTCSPVVGAYVTQETAMTGPAFADISTCEAFHDVGKTVVELNLDEYRPGDRGMTASLKRVVLAFSLSDVLLASAAGGQQPSAASLGPHLADQPATAAVDPLPWKGRYIYEFAGGATAGGSPIVVTYTLTLDRSTCHFQAEGFQTDEDIVCTTLTSGDTLDVRFKSYGNGQLEDKYGNPVYYVGNSLFTLSKQGSMLITHWTGFSLPDDRPHSPGVYFHH